MLDLGRVSSLFVYPKRFMYSMFTIQGKIVKHKRIIFPRKRKHVISTMQGPYIGHIPNSTWHAFIDEMRHSVPKEILIIINLPMIFPWFSHGFPRDIRCPPYTPPHKKPAPTVAPVPELHPRPSGCGDRRGALRQGLLNTGRVTSDESPFFVYRWMNYKVVPPR